MKLIFKIILRADYRNADGSQTLYLRLTKGTNQKYYSLNIKVRSRDWNENKGIVSKSDPDHFRKNKYIRLYKKKANEIIDRQFFNSGATVIIFKLPFVIWTISSNNFKDGWQIHWGAIPPLLCNEINGLSR